MAPLRHGIDPNALSFEVGDVGGVGGCLGVLVGTVGIVCCMLGVWRIFVFLPFFLFVYIFVKYGVMEAELEIL